MVPYGGGADWRKVPAVPRHRDRELCGVTWLPAGGVGARWCQRSIGTRYAHQECSHEHRLLLNSKTDLSPPLDVNILFIGAQDVNLSGLGYGYTWACPSSCPKRTRSPRLSVSMRVPMDGTVSSLAIALVSSTGMRTVQCSLRAAELGVVVPIGQLGCSDGWLVD